VQIILIDDVFDLGKRGEVLQVADGYGRNYLIPKRLALPATPGNLKMIEQQRLALAKKETRYREEAQILARELEQLHLILGRKAGETGVLFGSVTSKDVGDLLEQAGIHLDRRKIVLTQPIKNIGNYKLKVHPHSEVEAEFLLSVLVEADQLLTRVKKKDEESDQIVAELEAKIKEIEERSGAEAAQEAKSTGSEDDTPGPANPAD
jgi:large subunit ribosomal protein L9